MRVSPHARVGNDALSHKIDKGGPIAKPELRKKGPKGLARTQMERKPSKLKRGPVGHASPEQKAKVEREGARLDKSIMGNALLASLGDWWTLDAAHIVPRAHGGCDHEDCIVPLPRCLHNLYDNGELDILPFLSLAEQAHAASHVGLLGALKRTTGENYVPEAHDA